MTQFLRLRLLIPLIMMVVGAWSIFAAPGTVLNPAKRFVMTWVPPYAVAQCQARLAESYEGTGMKDALTHLGLQFWVPTPEGGVSRVGRTNETGDAAIIGLRDWGRAHGVRVLLCVHNAGKTWDWSLAQAAFARQPAKFTDALLAEMDRLELDGVDLDLEGNGTQDADKPAFIAFVRGLSARLHAQGKHLTVDTFAYHWNAPNQTWWAELLPHVDGLTAMGYAEIGAGAAKWRGYSFQKAAAGEHAAKLMLGMPSRLNDWLGGTLQEHLQWVKQDGEVGVAFWDAQLKADAWRQPATWKTLEAIKLGP